MPPQPAGLLEFDRNECDWWANSNRYEECNRFNKKKARNAIIQANKVIAVATNWVIALRALIALLRLQKECG